MLKFKITQFICALLISCLICSVASADSYWNLSLNDNGSNSKNETGEKSPADKAQEAYLNDLYLGYFIAIVPGFYVHGLGNMYAGNWGRGLILFGVELASIPIIFLYGMGLADGEGEGPNAAGHILGITVIGLFFGTWLWDIGTVGGQVGKRHPNRVKVHCGPLPLKSTQYNSPVFGLSLSINF